MAGHMLNMTLIDVANYKSMKLVADIAWKDRCPMHVTAEKYLLGDLVEEIANTPRLKSVFAYASTRDDDDMPKLENLTELARACPEIEFNIFLQAHSGIESIVMTAVTG